MCMIDKLSMSEHLVKGKKFEETNDDRYFWFVAKYSNEITDAIAAYRAAINYFTEDKINELCGDNDSCMIEHSLDVIDGKITVTDVRRL